MSNEEVEAIRRAYFKAFELYLEDMGKWYQWYAGITGLSVDEVKLATSLYRYDPVIEVNEAWTMLRRAGLKIPSYSILREAVTKDYY